MAGEDDLQKRIYREVRKYIEKSSYKDLEVGKKVKIIKDCTFVPSEGKFVLHLGHAETDIAIYKKSKEISEELKEGHYVKLSQSGSKEIKIPLIVLELKRGKITTDSIRSRTIIAREMKEIFPFIAYFFVADKATKTDATMYRQGKHFTSFFVKKNKEFDGKSIRNQIIKQGVKPHLEKLKNLGII